MLEQLVYLNRIVAQNGRPQNLNCEELNWLAQKLRFPFQANETYSTKEDHLRPIRGNLEDPSAHVIARIRPIH